MRQELEAEFVAFVAHASPRLLTSAWMLTGDPHSAEDLVQEAMEKVYLRWAKLHKGYPVAYARRCLVTLHTDRWRRRRHEVLTDDLLDRTSGAGPMGHRVDLIRALQTLPARERQCVVLRHYLDQSEKATAHALGVSLGTVKSSTSRGLATLRGLLLEEETSHA